MRTALIQVMSAGPLRYEVRLDPDWDGLATPGADAPSVSFDACALPAPPPGFPNWINFLLRTDGASPSFHMLGCALQDLLIAGDIEKEFNKARMEVPQGLLRLLLKVEPPELDELPWEFMRKGNMTTFTDASMPVARVAASYNPRLELPEMCWPLRVMLVLGSEDRLIQVEKEIEHVKDAFRKVCGLVDIEVARLPDRERVRKQYEETQPHVFHFVGHGGLDEELGGYLRLEQKDAAAIQWTAAAIRDDLFGGALRLAVLNACQSGMPDEHGGTRAAVQGLVELKVPAVIAMQGPIRGDSAASFAIGLFEALSTGMPLDSAVARARVKITDDAPANRREYALPSLTFSASPDRILDLSRGDPRARLAGEPLGKVLSYVDRIPRRRQLWERLRQGQPTSPKIFAVTGPSKAGKGSLVRWCLGVASVWGYPVVLADFSKDEYVDSVSFLTEFASKLTSGDGAADTLASLQAELDNYRAERSQARARGRAYDKSPLYLYEKLSKIIATLAAERTLVIGIDALASVETGAWQAHAVPGLVLPIVRGQAGNVRLIVALQENERAERFSPQYFDSGQVGEIPIQLFPSAQFVELVSQRLRALNYTRASFEIPVNDHYHSDIKTQPYWDAEWFDLLDLRARKGHWAQEEA
jgi:hypothetical protein